MHQDEREKKKLSSAICLYVVFHINYSKSMQLDKYDIEVVEEVNKSNIQELKQGNERRKGLIAHSLVGLRIVEQRRVQKEAYQKK